MAEGFSPYGDLSLNCTVHYGPHTKNEEERYVQCFRELYRVVHDGVDYLEHTRRLLDTTCSFLERVLRCLFNRIVLTC